MNTPQNYLPPDMGPPPPALAPQQFEDLFTVVHTRMVKTEEEVEKLVDNLQETKEKG